MSAGSVPVSARRRLLRYLRRFAVLVVAAYLGVILVLMALENFLLFPRMRASEGWVPPPNRQVQDVTFHTATGTRIHAWWCPLDRAHGVVLYSHGNGGNLSHRADEITYWQRYADQEVLIYDYPGYGHSDGKPTEAGCYESGEAAYQWLLQVQKKTPRDIILYGSSLGGAVAVELATHHPYRALVLNSTFTSIPDIAQELYPWLPARWLVRSRFDNLSKIRTCRGPIFIAHGDCDRTIPCAHSYRLFDAAPEPKKSFWMSSWDHNYPPPPEFYTTLMEFLTGVHSDREAG